MGRLRSGRIAVWLTVILAACVGLILFSAIYTSARSPQMFIGRTTLLVRSTVPGVSFADLPAIVTGPEVKIRAENTMKVLGITLADRSRPKVSAEIVPDTHIIEIEVIDKNPEVAKASADVYAAEFRRYVKELALKAKSATKTTGSSGSIRIISPVSVRKDGEKHTARIVIVPDTSKKGSFSLSAKELARLASTTDVTAKAVNTVDLQNAQAIDVIRTLRVEAESSGRGHVVSIEVSAKDPKDAVEVVEAVLEATREKYTALTAPTPEPLKTIEPAYVFPKERKFGLF